MTDVLFAEQDLTIHVKLSSEPVKAITGELLWNTESRMLFPGQSIPISDLPDYLVESLKAGRVAGARLVTSKEADEIAAKAAVVRELAEGQLRTGGVEYFDEPVVQVEEPTDVLVVGDTSVVEVAAGIELPVQEDAVVVGVEDTK